jgi:hypothetical protein
MAVFGVDFSFGSVGSTGSAGVFGSSTSMLMIRENLKGFAYETCFTQMQIYGSALITSDFTLTALKNNTSRQKTSTRLRVSSKLSTFLFGLERSANGRYETNGRIWFAFRRAHRLISPFLLMTPYLA